MTRSLLVLLFLTCCFLVAYYLWPFLQIMGYWGSLLFLGGVALVLTLVLTPVLYPLVRSMRQRPALPQRWLFVLVVACLCYGGLTLLLVLAWPVEIYLQHVAPQLQVMSEATPLVGVAEWLYQYGWLLMPTILALPAVPLTRYLLPRWARVVDALRD
jgi:hypothetical protein